MEIIYRAGIWLFSLLVKIVAPFSEKANQIHKGRATAIKRLMSGDLPQGAIWVHCASLGEFEQGRPVIEKIKSDFPDEKIVVTFFSPSGFEIRKNYPLADAIIYLPADTHANAKLLVSKLKPKMAFFVKYEYWHFYIAELAKCTIPIYLVSAIFRPNQIFFKGYGGWFRQILQRVSFFYCQDEKSVALLKSIGIESASVVGDTRFDRVYEIAKSAKSIPNIDLFIDGKMVIIAGSTWLPDEAILLEYISKHPDIKLIIAPHEVDSQHINKIVEMIKVPYALYTDQKIEGWREANVLVINTIGLLSSLYQYGVIGYIGGGFGKGIHNTLEAATFGLPVIFGPKYQKFKEARDLIAHESGFSINSYSDFETLMDRLIRDSNYLKMSSNGAKNYVEREIGATEKILKKIF